MSRPVTRGAHTVTAREGGYYIVLSGQSGATYQVTPTAAPGAVPGGATCECRWFTETRGQKGPCTHVLAVQEFAARVLPPIKPAEILAQSDREIAAQVEAGAYEQGWAAEARRRAALPDAGDVFRRLRGPARHR